MDSIRIDPDNSFRIKVKAPPVDGKANEYVEKYIAEVFDLPKRNVQIIAGFTGSHKRINIVADESHIQKIISQLKSTR